MKKVSSFSCIFASKQNKNSMKRNHIITCAILCGIAFLVSSCGLIAPFSSRFVDVAPELGMSKEKFLSIYGTPLRQNIFYDEDNTYCEELIYRERIEYDARWYSRGEERAINSIFLFRQGKLVSQFQEDDVEYQHRLERMREQQLIEERIRVERKRIAAEKERSEKEKE